MKTPPTISTTLLRKMFAVTLVLLIPSVASAHPETGGIGGFVSGFLHPLTGLDHIVAMVAVGLWGAYLGAPAMWLLPVIFPVVMAFGGALGILGVPLPGTEIGIALSGVLLGLAVAFAARPPLWIAGVIVGVFAIFHGHAHGTELPHAANALTYAVGFRPRDRPASSERNRAGSAHPLAVGNGRRAGGRRGDCLHRLRLSVWHHQSVKAGRQGRARFWRLVVAGIFVLLPAPVEAHTPVKGLGEFANGFFASVADAAPRSGPGNTRRVVGSAAAIAPESPGDDPRRVCGRRTPGDGHGDGRQGLSTRP